MKQRLFGKNARRKFRSRAAESRKICSNTHTYTHTHTVVRARFLKRKIHTQTNKTKKERTKNSGEIKY